jgi:RimJ/RimL family protein N-acetyltransferase
LIELETGNDDFYANWVSDQFPGGNGFKPCTTIGVKKDGGVVGAVVFNNFRKLSRDIHLTVAGTESGWLRRGLIREIANYVFMQLGCIRLTVTMSKKNKRARKLAEGVGFVYEGKIRRGFDGINDAVIYGMLFKECRWLGDKK